MLRLSLPALLALILATTVGWCDLCDNRLDRVSVAPRPALDGGASLPAR